MKGDSKLIEALNDVLTGELTGINQYFIHAKMCESWGFRSLAKHSRQESVEEMRHADEVIERILHLEGVPNMQRLGKVKVGENVPEQMRLDHALEMEAVARLNQAIELAVELHDNGTRERLEKILVSEEEHIDWLESQFALIGQIGEQNYLAQQIHES